MNNNCQYRLIETEGCDAFDANDADDLFDTTIKRHQWEYEQICKSLTNGNCDDVISILLADTRKLRRLRQKTCADDAAKIVPIDSESLDSDKLLAEVIHDKVSISDHPSSVASSTLYSTSVSSSTTVSSGSGSSNETTKNASSISTFPSQSLLRTNKKPPVQPNRCSAIINLDKNRINLRRNRSKLLPRPISLPSSFNLLRNFRGNSVQPSTTGDGKVDLDFIKQLEDDIYRSREEILAESQRRRSKLLISPSSSSVEFRQDNKNCDKCNRNLENSQSNHQLVERNWFDDRLSRFNERHHVVLLLDAWQLQPMLMKCEYSSFFRHHDRCTIDGKRVNDLVKSKTRSILIVDKSAFYPVLMRYECDRNGDMHRDDGLTSQSNGDQHRMLCDCNANNCEKRKKFAKLFRFRVEQIATEMRNANKLNTSAFNASVNRSDSLDDSATTASTVAVASVDNASKERNERSPKSRFKRFFLQRNHSKSKSKQAKRNELVKSTKKCAEPSTVAKKKTILPKFNGMKTLIPNASENPAPLTSDGIDTHTKIVRNKSPIKSSCQDLNRRTHEVAMQKVLMQRNTKLNWICSVKPKFDAFSMRLQHRRHSIHTFGSKSQYLNQTIINSNDTTNDIRRLSNCIAAAATATMMPHSYDSSFCQLYKSISWSCADLIDINNADYLRQYCSIYANANENDFNENCWNDKLTAKHDQLVSTSKMNSILYTNDTATEAINNNLMAKSVKRRSSFRRLKRHSVGSATAMTDVVKAWVYRRRC